MFVHRGTGTFATEFGPIAYESGDYILLPKGTTFRQMPDDRDHVLLVVEAPGPIRMAEHENVGRHTPIDPTMLEVPDVADYGWPTEREYEVRLRHGSVGGHSSIFYKNDPLRTVRLEGHLFPFKLNIRHILPITSDHIHWRHSYWTTLEAAGVAILSYVPQAAVYDLNAEELPSYHRNIDMDEVMLPCRPRPVRPPPRPVPPHATRHIARRRRDLSRRIPEEAPAGPAPHRLQCRRRHLPPADPLP